MKYVAHVSRKTDGTWLEPHDLLDHLNADAQRDAQYAMEFQGDELALRAALLHDLGIYQPAWQVHLKRLDNYGAEYTEHRYVGSWLCLCTYFTKVHSMT